MFAPRVVRDTPDLDRVRALPRRKLPSGKAAARLASMWTRKLALTPTAELRPAQGVTLAEAIAAPDKPVQGVWCSLPVGTGKTLLCETAPLCLASKRAVLIIPATLRNKTYSDRRTFVGVWRTLKPPARIVSRELLSREENVRMLDDLDPDVLVIDESDELSNADSAATRRIDRFIWAKRRRNGWRPGDVSAKSIAGFNSVRVVAMTGTPTRRSIMGYWHILRWCLGDFAPVPTTRADAEQWASALDDASPRAGWRPNPGALGETLSGARRWYLDRLRSTPGVVIWDEDSAAGVPLTVAIEIAPPCPKLDAAFDDLVKYGRSPSGEQLSDPLSEFRIDGQLGCGLFTYLEPPPPKEWSEARRKVAKYIRKRCNDTRHAIKPLDTDAAVMRAHPDAPAVRGWLAVRDLYDPARHTRVKWLSTVTLKWAAKWLTRKGVPPSVLWCGGVEFASRLARETGLPYYGRKGVDMRTGRELHAADPKSSMICSWQANKRGFNLQAWRRQGIVQPPPSAKYGEQIIGRAHRAGAKLPVHFTWLATSGGTLDAFASCFTEAEFARDTAGHTQKILRAELEPFPPTPDNLRWATRDDEDETDT